MPQGSVLAPILFAIYINDLPDNLTKRITPLLYADDLKIIYVYKNHEDILQNCLNNLHSWTTNWGLTFAYDKCYTFYLRKQNLKTQYLLGDHVMQ